MEFRTPFNYDVNEASVNSGLECEDESLAQQHMRDECDINNMLERFGVTGLVDAEMRQPMQGDFTGITDYRSALDAVIQAEESFMQFDAKTRERFGNNPGNLLDFVLDVNNKDEAIRLGLIKSEDYPEHSKNVPDNLPPPAGTGQ